MERAGVDTVFLYRFADICHLSPEEFVATVLVQQLSAAAVVCGYNFRFGKGGAGDAAMLRTLLSYVLGIAAAVLLGTLCVRVRAAEVLLSPLLSAIRATPVTSFIVLALVWLSSSRVPVLCGFLMTLPVVYAALVQSARAIDPKLLEMARLYRFGSKKTLLHIYIPSVLPALTQSCLAAIGLCWKAVVAAEVIGVPKMAVGSRIYESKIYLETDSLLAWTLTIIALSVLLERVLRRLAAKVSEVRHE